MTNKGFIMLCLLVWFGIGALTLAYNRPWYAVFLGPFGFFFGKTISGTKSQRKIVG